MGIVQFKGAKSPVLAVRSWPVWELRRWLVAYIVFITLLDAVAIGLSAPMTAWRLPQLGLFGLLLAGSLATVERTRRAGENAGVIKDVYGVWELPIAILLPPVYALIAPIPRFAMMQWRGVSIPLYRRVFSAAAIGLAYGAASLAFHAFDQAVISGVHGSVSHATVLALAMGACGVLQWAVNNCLVDSRFDAKTGLLNAGTWEREANAEVARANRTRSSLAVALIDVDNFKAINDTHGHLAGDKALGALSRTIKIFLREYDLVGRFGGEEFSLLLPQTGEEDARRVAERMRSHIAEMPFNVGDKADSETIRLTVSIGVAALGHTGSQLTELLATADAALYRAKHAGRNQVWVTTDHTSYSSCVDSAG